MDEPPAISAARDAVHAAGEAHDEAPTAGEHNDEAPAAATVDEPPAVGEAHNEAPTAGEHDDLTIVHEAVERVKPPAAIAAQVDEPLAAASDAVHTAGEAHDEAQTAGEHDDLTPYGRKGHDEDDSVKRPVGDHDAQAQSKKGFDVQIASSSFEDFLMSTFCNLLMYSQQASVTAQFFDVHV